jgi:hypothetical protein
MEIHGGLKCSRAQNFPVYHEPFKPSVLPCLVGFVVDLNGSIPALDSGGIRTFVYNENP